MTRDEAIAALVECPRCRRWRCVPDCDHCWVDNHRCPPTPPEAMRLLSRAVEIGNEAAKVQAQLLGVLPKGAR